MSIECLLQYVQSMCSQTFNNFLLVATWWMVILCYAEAVVIMWGSIVWLLNCGPGFNSWGHTNVSTVSASFLAVFSLVTRLYLTNYLFNSLSLVFLHNLLSCSTQELLSSIFSTSWFFVNLHFQHKKLRDAISMANLLERSKNPSAKK